MTKKKKKKYDRKNPFFESPDGLFWKGRFFRLKEPLKRTPENNLISKSELCKKLKGLVGQVWEEKKAEILADLYQKKENELYAKLTAEKIIKPTCEADKHTLSDAIKKATQTPGNYIDLKSRKTKESYIQQLNVWEKEIGHLKLSEITS